MSDSVYPDHIEVILPAPYLTAIGKVCVQWAQLEVAVEMALFKLAPLPANDARSKIVTAHMTWPMRIDILEALIYELQPAYPHLSRFKTTIKPLLRDAQNGRNWIVHAFWVYDTELRQAKIFSVSARGKLKAKIDPVSVEDILKVADSVGRAAAAMWKLELNM